MIFSHYIRSLKHEVIEAYKAQLEINKIGNLSSNRNLLQLNPTEVSTNDFSKVMTPQKSKSVTNYDINFNLSKNPLN